MDTPNYTAVAQAFEEMRRLQERLDAHAGQMAEMLVGRLSKCWNATALARLKRELKSFNIQTGRWAE